MRTIIQPLDPQPVFIDPKPPGRWIWAPTVPITDMCAEPRGSAYVSWWNVDNSCDLMERYCPINRPKYSKVECLFDGTQWTWVVRISERKRGRPRPRDKQNNGG